AFPIELGEEHASASLELRMDPASDFLSASLTVTPDVGNTAHTYALKMGLTPENREVFVPGTGGIADLGTVEARTVVIDDDTHPFALVSSQGGLTITEAGPETEQPGAQPRLTVSSKPEQTAARMAQAPAKPARLD